MLARCIFGGVGEVLERGLTAWELGSQLGGGRMRGDRTASNGKGLSFGGPIDQV
jgi:hypothetical protein